eukprot:TRINITY_DN15418_c0_g1_i11.p2 TRINITY_DN15418_c0_g1~~TRINITY_DN15418_c0_g1_i11.p2  ORF type:complete len:221 (+),score=114.11 TRINITY_DN15418_c0_g1_i11:110-772(+)
MHFLSFSFFFFFFFQAEDGIRDAQESRGLGDVYKRQVSEYITQELNTFDIKVSDEESEYVVTKLDANMASIGKKFGKEGGKLKAALVKATPEQVTAFRAELAQTGKITVDGKELAEEDIKIVRTFREGITDYESNTDGQVVVLVDKRKDEGLMDAWRAREFVNRVMQLRKSAGLVVTDKVNVWFETKDEVLANAFASRADQINASVTDTWAAKDLSLIHI